MELFFLVVMFALLAILVAMVRLALKPPVACNCSQCAAKFKFKAAERGFELPEMCPDFDKAITDINEPLTPVDYYHKVWRLVRDNFLYSDRLAEFNAWEHAYDGRLNTFSEAGAAVRTMLASLKDRYSMLHDTTWCLSHTNHQKTRRVAASRMLSGGVGYLKLFTFDAPNVGDDFRSHLGSLKDASAIVLDLRGNLGGKVSAAIDVLDALVETDSTEGVHVFSLTGSQASSYDCKLTATSVVKEGKPDDEAVQERKGNLLNGRPLVLLMDRQSASASELVAGSLRMLKRTPIVGTKSFGKGVAQSLWYLDCGTLLRVTTAKVVLPGGDCIDGVGIMPDHVCFENMLLPGDKPLRLARSLACQLSRQAAVVPAAQQPILQPVR